MLNRELIIGELKRAIVDARADIRPEQIIVTITPLRVGLGGYVNCTGLDWDVEVLLRGIPDGYCSFTIVNVADVLTQSGEYFDYAYAKHVAKALSKRIEKAQPLTPPQAEQARYAGVMANV